MIKDKHLNSQQLGATLIEIMIAMLIGLFLLGGLIQIFSGSKQTYRLQDNMSRLQENGRFAMDFISRDIRMTDYWGCSMDGPGDPSTFTNNLTPNSPPAQILGISGTDNTGINGSDSITLVGASNAIPVTVNQGTASDPITVGSGSGLSQDDVVIIADCSTADVLQATNDPSSGTTIVHAADIDPNTGDPIQNATLSKRYGIDASVYGMSTNTYNIQPGALRPDGSRLPALFRNGVELVEGIENMQILYGVDTDASGDPGFGSPNYYIPDDYDATIRLLSTNPTTFTPNINQVISVRFNLLAITPDDNIAPAAVAYDYNGATNITAPDSRLRREFSTTIALRNRLR